MMINDELKHYGVLGMKWGIRRGLQKSKQKYLAKERQSLIDDAKKIKVKADPGKHVSVYGDYHQKRGGLVYLASHVVDEHGNVKLSYICGPYGDHYIAAGKDYVSKNIKLNDHFRRTPKSSEIEYNVYD